MSNILGVDPGLDGALAFIGEDGVHVFDMPTLTYQTQKKKNRREVDLRLLGEIIKKYPTELNILEGLAGMPRMGGTQMFTMGQGYGMLKAALHFSEKPYELVSPQKWKKYFGLSKDKDASREKASQLFPEHSHLWARKKDDGRAEAVLIALYGREQCLEF